MSTKKGLLLLFGLVIILRVWGHFTSSIELSDPDVGHLLVIRVILTLTMLLLMVLTILRGSVIARITLLIIFGTMIIGTVTTSFLVSMEKFTPIEVAGRVLIGFVYLTAFIALLSRRTIKSLEPKR